MTENEPRPFDAYDGGAKVMAAIREVLDNGGSVERALANGEAALRDLQEKAPPLVRVGPLNLGHSIGTNPPRRP